MKYRWTILDPHIKGRPTRALLAILLVTMASIAMSTPMASVDSELLTQLERAGNRAVPVLISCENECKSVIKSLEQAGIRITSTQSMVLGSIGAEITADQLEIVKKIPGVSAIEYDTEVKALH
jgi:hypothetical protein